MPTAAGWARYWTVVGSPPIGSTPSTCAVINSYVMPPVRAYFNTLGHRIDLLGVRTPLQIMQSNGGVTTREGAARYPVRLASSGPAAGVLGAAIVARQAGFEQLITLDMGGTSTDVKSGGRRRARLCLGV